MKIGIVKPGHNLDHIIGMTNDNSTFGGMYEIKGLYDDLVDLGHDVKFDLVDTEMLFIFNSRHNFTKEEKELYHKYYGPKIQCVTDMNLQISSDNIGHHFLLTQVEGPCYHPFEKYIVRYKFDETEEARDTIWETRVNELIYAGGSRDGARDYFYEKYLLNNSRLNKTFTSSSLSLPNKQPKIPMTELFREYQNTRFGLLIKDHNYNAFNFQTQRMYEYMLNGMVVLHDEETYTKGLFGQVSSMEELFEKMDEFTIYPDIRENQFSKQHNLLLDALKDVHNHKIVLEERIQRWKDQQ